MPRMPSAVRRFLESLAWLLIGLMFLYTVLQSIGLAQPSPDGDPLSVGAAVMETRA